MLTGACQGPAGRRAQPTPVTLRVGVSVGQMAAADPQNGLRQVAQNQSVEALVKIGEDGRPTAWLAQSWEFTPDGRTLKVHLRPDLKFHDGSAVTATTSPRLSRAVCPISWGPRLRTSSGSPRQDRTKSTSPCDSARRSFSRRWMCSSAARRRAAPEPDRSNRWDRQSPTELRANNQYYLGRPIIDRLAVNTYPTARAAWAEMLRDHLDMLYEVGTDALDSLERSNKIQVFTYLRHYQYALDFQYPETGAEVVGSPARAGPGHRSRRDRSAGAEWAWRLFVRPNLAAVTGPLDPTSTNCEFDPAASRQRAVGTRRLHFTCLVPPDYERMALVVKRQLDQVNVTMDVQELPPIAYFDAMARRDFDAVLFDVVSGPSMFRQFSWWHSAAATNPTGFSSVGVDAALDHIRHSASDDDYRAGVTAFQRAMDRGSASDFPRLVATCAGGQQSLPRAAARTGARHSKHVAALETG